MKKRNKKNIVIATVVSLLIAGSLLFFLIDNLNNRDNDSNNNSAVQETNLAKEVKVEENNTSTVAGVYENKKAGISFNYPESFKLTQDNLGSGEINSKLVLKDDKTDISITVYQNLHGINPQFSDYIYYMVKSEGLFTIFKRIEGEIPEKDTDAFSIIANFGDAEGTSKVNGNIMVMILNSKPNNTYEAEFKKVVTSLKEI